MKWILLKDEICPRCENKLKHGDMGWGCPYCDFFISHDKLSELVPDLVKDHKNREVVKELSKKIKGL
jgi:tRNA(Ile2) C34 agmatinyltransferase TiaS